MVGPSRSVAQVRVAVREGLAGLPADALVMVACSGGPDSLALASALAFAAPRAGLRAGLVTVDHQLQPGSAARAERVAAWARDVQLDPVVVSTVHVGTAGGPEAAARAARYRALEECAAEHRAAAVLLGHTREDQAETVLLALARGSGAHAIAGMSPWRGIFRRPLLAVPRSVVHAAAAAEALPVWQDPHNNDERFTRSRLRALLSTLEATLGGGVIAGLARSAALARDDAELLDELAERAARRVVTADASVNVALLAREPAAIRTRVLHMWALRVGASAGALAGVHIAALHALVVDWRGQGAVYLPGGIEVLRLSGYLRSRAA